MRTVLVAALSALAVLACTPCTSVQADVLGNQVIDRNQTDGAWHTSGISDFLVVDLAPEMQISQQGTLTRWRWDAKQWATNTLYQQMDLLVWRPVDTVSNTYELVFKQRVTSKVWGIQSVAADGSASNGSLLVKPGDVLGYYVPYGYDPVLALDYASGASGDPYWLSCGTLSVGTQHVFNTANGIRNYSLSAEITPEPSVVPEPGVIVAACSILTPAAIIFRRKSSRKRDDRRID